MLLKDHVGQTTNCTVVCATLIKPLGLPKAQTVAYILQFCLNKKEWVTVCVLPDDSCCLLSSLTTGTGCLCSGRSPSEGGTRTWLVGSSWDGVKSMKFRCPSVYRLFLLSFLVFRLKLPPFPKGMANASSCFVKKRKRRKM